MTRFWQLSVRSKHLFCFFDLIGEKNMFAKIAMEAMLMDGVQKIQLKQAWRK